MFTLTDGTNFSLKFILAFNEEMYREKEIKHKK